MAILGFFGLLFILGAFVSREIADDSTLLFFPLLAFGILLLFFAVFKVIKQQLDDQEKIKNSQKNPKIHILVAQKCLKKGNSAEAMKHFKRSLMLKDITDKEKLYIYNQIAKIFEDSKLYDKAITTYKAALQITKDTVKYNTKMAAIYEKEEKQQDAIACYEKAADSTTDATAKFNLAQAYVSYAEELKSKEDKEGALTYLKKAVAIWPNDSQIHYLLGEVYDLFDDEYNALKCYEESVSRNATFADPLYKMGLIYKKKNKKDKAVESFTKAIKADEKHIPANWELGSYYHETGNYNQAMQHFRIIEKYDPRNTDALYEIGLISTKIADVNSTINAFKKVITIDPFHIMAFYNLACAHSVINDREHSLYYLQCAIANGYDNMYRLKVDPLLKSVREDPRFEHILEGERPVEKPR